MMRSILFLLTILFAFNSVKAQTETLTRTIENSADDAEQEGSFVDTDDLELDLGWSNGEASMIGLFFRNSHVDPGATIDSAWLSLTLQADLEDSIWVMIQLENNPYPSAYSDTMELKEGRAFHPTTQLWQISPGSKGSTVHSPNLAALLNNATESNDWSPSAGFNLVLEPADTLPDSAEVEIQIYSYDQSIPDRRPTLSYVTNTSSVNGVAESSEAIDAVVFPNPFINELSIRASSEVDKWTLMSLQGTVVAQGKGTYLSLLHLSAGKYLLTVSHRDGSTSHHRVQKH